MKILVLSPQNMFVSRAKPEFSYFLTLSLSHYYTFQCMTNHIKTFYTTVGMLNNFHLPPL